MLPSNCCNRAPPATYTRTSVASTGTPAVVISAPVRRNMGKFSNWGVS